MSQKNINTQLEIIEMHLKSEEIIDQVTALKKLKESVAQSAFSSQDLENILPIVFRIYRDGDVVMRTDIIDVLCLIGKQDFMLIDPVFQELTQEVEKKNQFHLPLIFSLIAKYSGSNIKKIQDTIRKILEEGAKSYSRPELHEILQNFWEQVLSQGFSYVSKNKTLITELLSEYRKEIPSLALLFQEKITSYEEFLKSEAKRKQEAEEKLKQEQREREELRKRRVKLMDKIREKNTQESSLESTPQSHQLVKTEPSMIHSESSTSDSTSKASSTSPSNEENPNFVSFSKLGLKKKEKSQEDS